MKQKIFSILMLAATLPFVAGCSSDDEQQQVKVGIWPAIETVSQAPHWEVTLPQPKGSTQGKPNWQWDDQLFRDFSKDMTAILALDGETVELSTPDDRMAAIVNGQVRFIAEPVFSEMVIAGETERFTTFYLYIPFETGEDAVDIQYYNARLNSTITRRAVFSVNDDIVGNEDFKMFELFPKTSYDYILAPNQPFKGKEGDQMAVFADGVCCGVLHAFVFSEDDISWAGRVYDDMHQGKVYVRYYSAEQHTIYTTEATLSGAAYSEVYLDFNK